MASKQTLQVSSRLKVDCCVYLPGNGRKCMGALFTRPVTRSAHPQAAVNPFNRQGHPNRTNYFRGAQATLLTPEAKCHARDREWPRKENAILRAGREGVGTGMIAARGVSRCTQATQDSHASQYSPGLHDNTRFEAKGWTRPPPYHYACIVILGECQGHPRQRSLPKPAVNQVDAVVASLPPSRWLAASLAPCHVPNKGRQHTTSSSYALPRSELPFGTWATVNTTTLP
ncbi:hypothetical protein E2C01_014830 [Portunus trituberculatus]|uniref:Uncharacterized protein n=1 Tax=Portunus trituberculatus TaxID=210409 RepID=A0A5B7DL82_PORTR|nr:hypothetical protein [Portunus trituberculatus]